MENKKKYFGIIENQGELTHSRLFASRKTFSNWANKQFSKNHSITITEYEMDMETFDTITIAEWHE